MPTLYPSEIGSQISVGMCSRRTSLRFATCSVSNPIQRLEIPSSSPIELVAKSFSSILAEELPEMEEQNMPWHKTPIARRANRRKSIFVAVLLYLAALLISPDARAQSDCKPVHDATDNLNTVPSHGYQTETNPARPGSDASSSEIIHTGGAIYVMMKGKWKKSPMSSADMRAQEEENWKTAKNVSCKYLRDESVNGQLAAVYKTHNENEDTKEDGQVWVSKSKGLVLREEEDVDIGGGDKRHISTRYEYGNVQAPAVSP